MFQEKLTDSEAWLWFILTSPALSAEFFWSDDKGESLRLWYYQWEYFDNDYDREFSFCARFVSKSWCAASRVFTFPFRAQGETLLITAAEGVHLETLLSKIDIEIESSYIHNNSFGRARVKPFYKRVCFNNSKIFARIPQKTGKGIKSIHAQEVIIDEFQDFTPKAKSELIEVYKSAGRRFISGVPETQSDPYVRRLLKDDYYKVWRFPRMKNKDWDAKLRREKIIEYGGEDTPEYRRNVYGEAVEELNSIFKKRVLYSLIDTDESSPVNRYYEKEVFREEQVPLSEIYFAPYKEDQFSATFLGLDLGWVDAPTTAVVLGKVDRKYALFRIYRFYRYDEPDKLEIIKRIFSFFDPKIIGVDASGAGAGLYQLIKSSKQGIFGIDFRRKVKISEDKEAYLNDLTVDLLVSATEKREIIFPYDEAFIKELASATITRGERNKYTKGIHELDALRVVFGALWLSEGGGLVEKEEDLFVPQVVNLNLP